MDYVLDAGPHARGHKPAAVHGYVLCVLLCVATGPNGSLRYGKPIERTFNAHA